MIKTHSMNSKDLRIGNYVEAEGMICEVMAVTEGGTHIEVRTPQGKTMEVSTAEVKSIMLSDELLMTNCGFDKDGLHVIGIDHHRYYLKIQDGYIVLLNQEGDSLIHFWDIRSLHQLQNLYNSLKGKEMKIFF
jgi:translation elongation factor P/translation initiation factor 5A